MNERQHRLQGRVPSVPWLGCLMAVASLGLVATAGCVKFPEPLDGIAAADGLTDTDADTLANSPDGGPDSADGKDDVGDVAQPPCDSDTCAFGCLDGTCLEVKAVAVGSKSSCVATATELVCWGAQYIGNNGSAALYTPTGLTVPGAAGPTRSPMADVETVEAIAMRAGRGVVLVNGSEPRYWGLSKRLPFPRDPLEGAAEVRLGRYNDCTWTSGTDDLSCTGPALNGAINVGDGGGFSTVTYAVSGLPSGPEILDLDVGERHACALMSTGNVWCWGDNSRGQLGTGDLEDRASAAQMFDVLDGRVSAVAVGSAFGCAIADAGEAVYCWGDNRKSQVGQAASWATVGIPIPVALAPGQTVQAIDLGREFGCLVDTDGAVFCWGLNTNLQLGTVGTNMSSALLRIDGLPPMATLSAGDAHVCGLARNGTVWCWGAGAQGQLGDKGESGTESALPLEVTYAADKDARQWCDEPGAAHPTRACSQCVPADNGAIWTGCPWGCAAGTCLRASQLAVGHSHSCVLDGVGDVWCWGRPQFGELGDGTKSANLQMPPRQAVLPGPADLLALGAQFSCARLSADGSLVCWGDDGQGQLGSPLVDSFSKEPLVVALDAPVLMVAAAFDRVCAVLERPVDPVACWGTTLDGSLSFQTIDELPKTVPWQPAGPITHLAMGSSAACAVVQEAGGDALYCWGFSYAGIFFNADAQGVQVPVQLLAPGPDIQGLALSTTLCVEYAGGGTTCWGARKQGQLGLALTADSPMLVPTDITEALPDGTHGLAAYGTFVCGTGLDGDVYCWGESSLNAEGGFDQFTAIHGPQKVPVSGSPVLGSNSCALDDLGFVRCWPRAGKRDERVGIEAGQPYTSVPPVIGRFAP